MTMKDYIAHCCIDKHISQAELARRIGTSPQNFNKKLINGTLRVSDLTAIAAALDAVPVIRFTDKHTGAPLG